MTLQSLDAGGRVHQVPTGRNAGGGSTNIDRVNINNLLITPDWKVVLIDHSRSFKNVGDLRSPKDLTFFSKSLMGSLRELEEKALQEHCSKWLTIYEIRMMLQRRDKIVRLYDQAVAENKPGVVYP